MRINWKIVKQRGNYRPSLRYKLTLEEYERELAAHSVKIQSFLPCLGNPHQSFCLPGTFERSAEWQPVDYQWITTPSFKEGWLENYIRLPFRESGKYPEVEQSFILLREQHEQVIKAAYGWEPIDCTGELDTSNDTKEVIAAALTAQKMIAFA
ncbi:MAG: hypothetical protein CSA26_00530 [Desulfobacterales bacterium]|nr:MAG: hypothetical protein CSA26_00530 [Desulfobacterales bacterium]